MKEWYSNAELAAAKIPGFPATEPGVSAWFKNRDTDRLNPGKVRRRRGRGGGFERHVSLLPRGARSILAIRHLKEAESTPLEEAWTGQREIPEPPATEAGELRRDAILLILNFWDIHRNCKFDGPLESARHNFVTLYRNGLIQGIPDWVHKAMRTADGKSKGLCVNTLRNWERKRTRGDFTGLAGDYGNRRGAGILDRAETGEVALLLAALIVKQPHLTAGHLRDQIRDRYGDFLDVNGTRRQVPPVRTIQRWVSAWKAEHEEALLKLTDPDAWKSKMRFSGTNMNHWVKRPNQLWEIDASPADVLLRDGRCSIYDVKDIYTRRTMVTVAKTPTTQAVLALIRKAILAWGVPEIIRTDNGSDFTSHEFRRAVAHLGIHQDVTAPFSPEQKGSVERAIGTLQRGLMPLLPEFIGHDVADRNKIEARRTFAQRLGENDKDAFCVELTAGELQDRIDDWLRLKYEHAPHGGLDGKTPFEVAAAWSAPLRRIEDERALDLLVAPLAGKNGIRTVTKFGIQVDKGHYISPDLVPGRTVFCRQDPADMGRIYVFSADGREFITVAVCPERAGVDPGDAIREVRAAQKRRLDEEVKPLKARIKRMKPTDMIDAVLRVAERDSGSVTAFPMAADSYVTEEIAAASEALRSERGEAEVVDLTPHQAKIQERIAAEMEAVDRVPTNGEGKKERFLSALAIKADMDAGKDVLAFERRWVMGYMRTSEFRSMRMLFDDFGEQALG